MIEEDIIIVEDQLVDDPFAEEADNDLDDKVENAGKGNPYRAKDGKFTTGGQKASAMTDAEMESLSDKVEIGDIDDEKMAKNLMDEIYHKQGFNKKPEVLSDAQFDELADDHVVLYRNVAETDGGDKFKQAFKTGAKHFIGAGIYGNGTYVTPDAGGARLYGMGQDKAPLLQMIIKPGSKQAIYSEMVTKARKQSDKMTKKAQTMLKSENDGERLRGYKLATTAKLVADPGIYAASRGYDFMSIDTEQTNLPQTVIFNRGALTVSEGYYTS